MVGLTQNLMEDLFQVAASTAKEHIKNIFNKRKFIPDATILRLRIVNLKRGNEMSILKVNS